MEERITLESDEVWRKKNSSGALLQERQTLHILDGEPRAALIEHEDGATLSYEAYHPHLAPAGHEGAVTAMWIIRQASSEGQDD